MGLEGVSNEELVDEFHKLWYRHNLSWTCKWRGTQLIKCPFDLQVYHELIWSVRPTIIVETGTHEGGSALFLADMLALTGQGRVITIDIANKVDAYDPRITYLIGDSTSEPILSEVRSYISLDDTVMVILDSCHQSEFVYAEMHSYAPLVTIGSYMIVEDSNIAGHPVGSPGDDNDPWSAIMKFLDERNDFMSDKKCERFLVTQNPNGYLRKVK